MQGECVCLSLSIYLSGGGTRGVGSCAFSVAVFFYSNPCPGGNLLRRSGEAGTDSIPTSDLPRSLGEDPGAPVSPEDGGNTGLVPRAVISTFRQPLSQYSASGIPWPPGNGDTLAPPAHAETRTHVIRHNDTWQELPASRALMTHLLPAHLRGW